MKTLSHRIAVVLAGLMAFVTSWNELSAQSYPKLSYNMQKDFAPVTQVSVSPYVLLLHPSMPVHTLGELIALARSRPGALNYASAGSGGPGHLAGELFQAMANVKMVHVAYKGTVPGLTSVMTGETNLIFTNIAPAVPAAVRAGRLRAITMMSVKRSAAFPNVPTVAESGMPGLEAQSRYGVLAPAGTPREIIMRLNAAMVKGLQSDEARRQVETDGSEIVPTTPEELARIIASETERWSRIIKTAGIKPEE